MSGTLRDVLTEREKNWVDLQPVRWVEDGRAFLWASERDGWRHVYRVSLSGGEPEFLTPGDFDFMTVAVVDEAAGWDYVIASPEDPSRRYLPRRSWTLGVATAHLHDLYLGFLETHMPPGPRGGPAGAKKENDS